jgi:hypothetical protein
MYEPNVFKNENLKTRREGVDMDKPQKRNGPFLVLLPLWHIASWMEMAILLGYIGVIVSAVDLGRKYLQDSYRKKSAQEFSEEMILNLKKVLRLFFIFVLLAGIIWSREYSGGVENESGKSKLDDKRLGSWAGIQCTEYWVCDECTCSGT